MPQRIKNWSVKDIQKEANKYSSRGNFQKCSPNAYDAAIRKDILDQVCNHMEYVRNSYTDEDLKIEASRYKTKRDFRKLSPNHYNTAHKRNLIDSICSHMDELRKKWTIEELQAKANQYNSRGDFKKYSANAYAYAFQNHQLDSICAHMVPKLISWTDEMLIKEGKKYSTRQQLKRACQSAYDISLRRGILETVCAHMEREGPTDNDAIYIWEATNQKYNGKPVYKVGATSFRLGTQRIKQVAKQAGFNPELVTLEKVSCPATSIERQILKLGDDPKFCDHDGATEFRAFNERELNLALQIISQFKIKFAS